MRNDYTVIDLETTGLSPRTDKIIEIGAVKVINGQVAETYATFLNPGRLLTPRITQLTGITDADLADAPYIETELAHLIEFIGDDCLVGHNLIFDYSFVKKAAANSKRPFEKQGLDTLRIARAYLPQLPSKKLGELCDYYHIPITAHRALGDALATHELYQRLAAQFYSEESALFVPKPLNYQVKKESPITSKQKEQLTKLCAKYAIELTDGHLIPPIPKVTTTQMDMERMSKNEASRLYDKIIATQCGCDIH